MSKKKKSRKKPAGDPKITKPEDESKVAETDAADADDGDGDDDEDAPGEAAPASEAKPADPAKADDKTEKKPEPEDAKDAKDAKDDDKALAKKPPRAVALDKRKSNLPAPEPPDLWDKSFDWIFKHGALPALAIITVVVGILYLHLFDGEPKGDDLTFHMAEAARISDCLRAGDFDLWNPSANAGYASAYYYQVIPQLTAAVPAALFGHLLFWFQLSNWLPLVLAPVCAYRGMRMMGASPWQATIGAFCVAFMNGESRWGAGAAGSFHVGLYTQTWSLTAFPLALGYGARWIAKGEKLAPAVAWGTWVGLCHPFGVVSLGLALVVATAAQMILGATDQLFQMWGRALEPVTPKRKPMELIPRVVHDLATRWKNLPGVARIDRGRPVIRLVILGVIMLIAFMPVWLPLLVDYSGFGGFPHRVGDEVGPGFTELFHWHFDGKLLDFIVAPETRYHVLTWLFIPAVLFARGPYVRWLLAPIVFYVLMLGLGPHLGTTQDDLLPMVRFLGAMQTCMALLIGAGIVGIGVYLWKLFDDVGGAYIGRTVLSAIAVVLLALTGWKGFESLNQLVAVMGDPNMNQHREQMLQVADFLAEQPPGRKQVSTGSENHWWNLLTYVYGRTPALLQMGGGGLQASPNYEYLWSGRDLTKNAWLYAAPYLVFARQAAGKMPPGETLFTTTGKRVMMQDFNPFWPKVKVVDGPGLYEVRKLPAPELVSPVQVTGTLPAGFRKGEPGREAALAWLKTDEPLVDHVLAYDGFGGPSEPPDARTIKAWQQVSPGDDPDIIADVEVTKPTTFLVRESWHPRWHAFVDGEEIPVRRVTPDFPAVDVPVGKHEVTLRFERPWWAWASWLAWPGAAIGAWLLARLLARRKLLPPTPGAV